MSSSLPIFPVTEVLPELKAALANHGIALLEAPPGAGKSTIVPLALMDEDWLANEEEKLDESRKTGKKIIVLQPRRLAAKGVAVRMAALLGEEVGQRVGYRVRLEQRIGPSTQIEVVTEGILIKQLQADNALEGVGLVVFDEFHERSLQGDLALALCRECQAVLRPDLKLLLMSATLDAKELALRLDNAPIITSLGKIFPLRVEHRVPDQALPLHRQMAAEIARLLKEEQGDILAFLPGAGEIRQTADWLEQKHEGVVVHELYGDLPLEKQNEALGPNMAGKRKVVLATSIAETSLTIEGVRMVIDSGWARVPVYNPNTGLTKLETRRHTADSATQRAGRAARQQPGTCIRLYSEATQAQLLPRRAPEIEEADLAPLWMELQAWGVHSSHQLSWIDQPPPQATLAAKGILTSLGALELTNAGTRLTALGKAMAPMATHPRLARLLLAAKQHADRATLMPLAADVVALLEERDPLKAGADFTLRVEGLRKWRAGKRGHEGANDATDIGRTRWPQIDALAQRWCQTLGCRSSPAAPDSHAIGFLLAQAYPERIARQQAKGGHIYRLFGGGVAYLDSNDSLHTAAWLAIAHMEGKGKIYLAAPLDVAQLGLVPTQRSVLAWDLQREELVAETETRIGEIVTERRKSTQIDQDQKAEIICTQIAKEGLAWLQPGHDVQQLLLRLESMALWQPDAAEPWPNAAAAHLAANAIEWLLPYLGPVFKKEDATKLDLYNILLGQLSYGQSQALERLAPSKLAVPSGSSIALQYMPDGAPPVLAVRIQELFGLAETPAVCGGRVAVLIHLLSPGYKPMQVTQDLRSFWDGAYQEVRKELRNRYPRHSWPDDPWTAEAVRGAKKRGG